MNINFIPLAESHFLQLAKWLEVPHVKAWWDNGVVYTLDLVKEKYGSYIQGYKQVNGVNKSIQAYIINVEQEPIGYIQIYNSYDFSFSKPLLGLPKNLGALQ